MQKNIINKIIKKIMSEKLVFKILKIVNIKKIKKAKKALDIGNGDCFLGIETLDSLQNKYGFPQKYDYSKKGLIERGKKRAREVLSHAKNAKVFLEIGAHDATVSYCLSLKNKKCIAIDLNGKSFSEEAKKNVELHEMNAEKLNFDDSTIDCVFSYDSFEHFGSPEKVFSEIIRVLKPNGIAYFSFGPLYNSPLGMHAYNAVTVPYCQFLFSSETLKKYTKQNALEDIDYEQCNQWHYKQFKKLFYSKNMKVLKHKAGINLRHLDLIIKHPACFSKVSKDVNEFITSNIGVVLKKSK